MSKHLVTRLEAVRDKAADTYELGDYQKRFTEDEIQTLDAAIEALRIVGAVIGEPDPEVAVKDPRSGKMIKGDYGHPDNE